MGCQKKIANAIIAKGADYILMVKNSQKKLRINIEEIFEAQYSIDTSTDTDFGHGRIETRTSSIIDDLGQLEKSKDWKSIVFITSKRIIKKTNKTSTEKR